MNIAQSLYEGVDLGNQGAEGLITYMRTDSVRIEPKRARRGSSIYLKYLWKRLSPGRSEAIFH